MPRNVCQAALAVRFAPGRILQPDVFVHVERWTGPGLATCEEFRDALTTPLLPGFTLDVAELLKEP